MAVLFGEAPNSEGWVKVQMIHFKMDEHEEGYKIDAQTIPDYPEGGFGIGWVQHYHPGKDEWKFEQIKVPYTKEETLLEIATAIRELAQAIKEK